MPARRSRDPYRTPSPPPRRDDQRLSTIHHHPETTSKNPFSLAEQGPGGHLKRNSSSAEDNRFSGGLHSIQSTDSSPCSLPPLSDTPSSIASSIVNPPTTGEQGSLLTDSFVHGTFKSNFFQISPSATHPVAICLYNDLLICQRIHQEKTGMYPTPVIDTLPSASHFGVVSTQARLAARGPLVPSTALEHLQHPLHSLYTIARTIVVLKRCIQNKLNSRQQIKPHELSIQLTPTLQNLKKPDVDYWLGQCLQSETLSSNSETDSIVSFESDYTADDFDDESHLGRKEQRNVDGACWDREAERRYFLLSLIQPLSRLHSDTAASLFSTLSSLFDSWVALLVTSQQPSDSGASSTQFSCSRKDGTSDNANSTPRGGKRGRDDEDDESGNSGDTGPHKKQKHNGESNHPFRQKWACPYYQREPHRYCVETDFGDYRKCAKSPGFDQVHRVKAHIYKCHAPKYCDRCYEFFQRDEELEVHRRKDPACELKQPPVIDGLTTKQRALLKPRDRKSNSDEERWNVIYKICFPEDEILPSPYYVLYSREVAELRREVLEIVRVETESPTAVDVNRLMQRLQEAFSARLSPGSPLWAQRTPAVLTPSTTNDGTRSTGRSSEDQRRACFEESPSVAHASQQLYSAADVTTMMLSSDNLAIPHPWLASNNLPPASPIAATYVPGTDNDSLLPLANSPIPFRLGLDNNFDLDQYIFDMEGDILSDFKSQRLEFE